MKRIVRIITRLNVGGPAIQAIRLCQEFHGPEWDSLLITGALEQGETDMSYLASDALMPYYYLNEMKREIRPWNDFKALMWLRLTLRDMQPDIIHTHTAKAGLLGRLAAVLAAGDINAKVVHTFHGNSLSGYFDPVRNGVFRALEKHLARYTDAIVAISDRQQYDLVKKYKIAPLEKVWKIPLGFDLDRFFEIESRHRVFHERPECLNIGIIGRLEKVKNHDMFLRLARKCPSHSYFIIGDGRRREELLKKAAEMRDRVNFVKEYTHKEMVGVYKMLDLVVLCSHNEGTPATLIEAMASSRPCVATDVGGVRDLLGGRCGMLVKPDSAHDMALAINAMIKCHKMREQMVERAREKAKIYQMERLVSDLGTLYRRLLDGEKSKGRFSVHSIPE